MIVEILELIICIIFANLVREVSSNNHSNPEFCYRTLRKWLICCYGVGAGDRRWKNWRWEANVRNASTSPSVLLKSSGIGK